MDPSCRRRPRGGNTGRGASSSDVPARRDGPRRASRCACRERARSSSERSPSRVRAIVERVGALDRRDRERARRVRRHGRGVELQLVHERDAAIVQAPERPGTRDTGPTARAAVRRTRSPAARSRRPRRAPDVAHGHDRPGAQDRDESGCRAARRAQDWRRSSPRAARSVKIPFEYTPLDEVRRSWNEGGGTGQETDREPAGNPGPGRDSSHYGSLKPFLEFARRLR